MARITSVVNLRSEQFDVYIGRAGRGFNGYFGNPIVRQQGEARGATIERFTRYFEQRIGSDNQFRQRVLQLRGKRLGCFCKPAACHGDVIAAWVNAHQEEGS
jgi:hypothetical protein